tara:strand:+ start:7729 stop:8004 length:276 start_codon:yes stop_codon:yes gene_type:complete
MSSIIDSDTESVSSLEGFTEQENVCELSDGDDDDDGYPSSVQSSEDAYVSDTDVNSEDGDSPYYVIKRHRKHPKYMNLTDELTIENDFIGE